ncbi:MAG: Mur ligase domain-containing protein, partial [Candidatus Zixiibacteriota bacterium]
MVRFKKVKKLHFVGIGGTGMCGIAEILWNLGYIVTGSDIRSSESTDRLEKLGIKIYLEHKKENVKDADVLVVSSAVKDSNPEVIFAKENKIPVIRRAEMLGELMRMKYGIGVAGTHGKTTTTSMIGHILTEAGLDPTIIVGGRVRSLGSNAKLGQGEYLVAEADEFDRSFLRLTPTIAVVTTLEAEHLDYYKDLEEIKTVFTEFVNKVPFYGSVILCLDEKAIQEIIPGIERPIVTYGLVPQADLVAHS